MEYLGLILVLGALLFLLALSVHIAFAMMIVGTILLYLEKGTELFDMVSWSAWNSMDSFILTAVPLFLLMGEFIMRSKLSEDLYMGLTSWISWLPGKCLQSNIVSCAIFAAMTGSSVATAATFSKIAIGPQKRLNYSPPHIYGSLAAGGTLGILIPPSIDLIVYGSLTQTSVPKLFAAGIIPGLILASLFMLAILIQAVLKPNIAPPVPEEDTTWKARVQSLRSILPLVGLGAFILVSIYTGLNTPTEAAAIAAVGALLLVIAFGRFSLKLLWHSLVGAGLTTAWLQFILMGANVLTFGLGQSGIAGQSIAAIGALDLSTPLFMAILMGVFILLGCMVEGLSLTLLSVAIVFPIVLSMELSPIWFGVMMVLQAQTALITPPVGSNLFVVAGSAEVPVSEVVKGVIPFVLCLLIVIALLIAFPNLALFIPSTM